MATYFISDTHFGHDNVIKHSARPFANVEEMNEAMILNWNARVKTDDTVYILGDVCFKIKTEDAIRIVSKLNGHKILITGNHDRRYLKDERYRALFDEIADMKAITIDGEWAHLCHYPILDWDKKFRGAWHIFGHIHNRLSAEYAIIRNEERMLNAGAEIVGYAPTNFRDLIACNVRFKTENEHW